MKAQAETKALGLADYVERIIKEVQGKYPETTCLMNGEVYGDHDVNIDIYAPEEKVLEVERYAHEVAFDLTQGTDLLILPSVAPSECCSIGSM